MKTIYFLCTGNSARSQMAEGFAKYYGAETIKAYSAGIDPKGINPRTIEVMREAGVDISGQTSDPIDPEILKKSNLVITLCGDAAEKCPVVPHGVETRHWEVTDPAKKDTGVFRTVRDEIKQHVKELLDEFGSGRDNGCN